MRQDVLPSVIGLSENYVPTENAIRTSPTEKSKADPKRIDRRYAQTDKNVEENRQSLQLNQRFSDLGESDVNRLHLSNSPLAVPL